MIKKSLFGKGLIIAAVFVTAAAVFGVFMLDRAPQTVELDVAYAEETGALTVNRMPTDDTVAAYMAAYEGDGTYGQFATVAQWNRTNLTYSFVNCPTTLDCGAAHQAVRDAAAAWAAVSGLTLTETGGTGDIAVQWTPNDGPGGILGIAYFPLDFLGGLAGDIFLDDGELWVVNNPTSPQQIHLPTVILHELGHSLGLDHTGDSTAIMWAFYTGPRGLGADDIAGIQSLYGPPGGEAAPDPAPSQVQLFTNVNLRIRAQPTTSSQQVGTLAPNVQVPVLGRNPQTTWAYIDYNGVVGWVSLSFATVIGDINTVPVVQPGGADPTPPPPGDNPPIDPGAAVSATTTTNVVLRSGPGTNFARVTVVPFNTTVPVLGRNAQNSWVYVEYNNQPGWMAAFLVNIIGDLNAVPVVPPEGPGGNPTPPPDAPDPEPQGVTARANANIVIRSGPSVDNDRVGSLPFGSVVPVVGRNSNGQWILIEYQGQQGWIAAWLTTINGSLNDVPIVPGT